MKIWLRYSCFFAFCLLLFVTLLGMSQSPEARIEGQWKEQSWEYEKVNKNDTVPSDFRTVSTYVKDVAGMDLIIHKAEKWTFLPNGKLILQGKDGLKKIDWAIKGRGHILQLRYRNNIEQYNLTELSAGKLVLNFDTNSTVRGIARLTFEKI